jgi:hypothetical protein
VRVNNKEIKNSIRYWDKAGTEDGGAYTAGVLMHKMNNGTFVISHVARGQWSALERETKIKTYCDADRKIIKGPYGGSSKNLVRVARSRPRTPSAILLASGSMPTK